MGLYKLCDHKGRMRDDRCEHPLIVLRGVTTKSKKTRLVPISTQRLRAVLEWLRIDADGKQQSDETLVFSNEIGEALPLFHDSWLRTVLKAHGVKPRWSARLADDNAATRARRENRKQRSRTRHASPRTEYQDSFQDRAGSAGFRYTGINPGDRT